MSYVPLLPLALLLITSLYLFVLPYATKRRPNPQGGHQVISLQVHERDDRAGKG